MGLIDQRRYRDTYVTRDTSKAGSPIILKAATGSDHREIGDPHNVPLPVLTPQDTGSTNQSLSQTSGNVSLWRA
jgi:hypothetical protein